MCDFYSWIEKDGKMYYLDDATIKARWPSDDMRKHIGHSSIEEIFPESHGGKHCENAIDVPRQIAKEINRGHMDKIAKAGQWAGARYDQRGHLSSKWWRDVEQFCKALNQIKWLDNHGAINPAWKVFETRGAARDAAYDAASDAACDAAYAAAYAAARYAAYGAARAAAYGAARDAACDAAYAAACDAGLYARCLIADPGLPHSKHATDRLDVWLRGYGLLCDINGMLYVYKKI